MNDKKFLKSLTILPSLAIFGLLLSGFYNTFVVSYNVQDPKLSGNFTKRTSSRVSLRNKAKLRGKFKRTKYIQKPTRALSEKKEEQKKNEHAHIQDSLDLKLVEFFNSKHFDKVLKGREIEGYLEANNGVIESMEIILPDNHEIIVEQTQMNGNIFTYHHEGELYSGLIYQSGNKNYSVSLINGPYQGSKMRFAKASREISNDENIDSLAQDNNQDYSYEEKEDISQVQRDEKEAPSRDAYEDEGYDEVSQDETIDENPYISG